VKTCVAACSTRFERVLAIVYDTRDYWVFGLCPSSGILRNTKEYDVSAEWICLRPQVSGWETQQSTCPSPSQMRRKQIQYPKPCVILCSLEYRTMDIVIKPVISIPCLIIEQMKACLTAYLSVCLSSIYLSN
jgi:hypothetical protein